MKLSVLICSHNPRPDYLQRTLEHLRAQTLPLGDWELILVDNASATPISGAFDLGWHPHARIVHEPQLGLVHARLRGFAEAQAPTFCQLDDDNLLAPDYLVHGLRRLAAFPQLGAFSGRIEGEFEVAPEPEVVPFLGRLAIWPCPRAEWGNLYQPSLCPCGAGMFLRREVAEAYVRTLAESPLRKSFGRKGADLASSEDTDIAFCAIDLGYGIGKFPELQMTHLMPARRVTREYLLRLAERGSETEELLLLLRGIRQPSKSREIRTRVEEVAAKFLLKGFNAQMRQAIMRGQRRALQRYRELQVRPA